MLYAPPSLAQMWMVELHVRWGHPRTFLDVACLHCHPPHCRQVPLNQWQFDEWVPHAVVINAGTNDGLVGNPSFVNSYNATLLTLVKEASRAYGGRATFFLLCGPMAFQWDGIAFKLNPSHFCPQVG